MFEWCLLWFCFEFLLCFVFVCCCWVGIALLCYVADLLFVTSGWVLIGVIILICVRLYWCLFTGVEFVGLVFKLVFDCLWF